MAIADLHAVSLRQEIAAKIAVTPEDSTDDGITDQALEPSTRVANFAFADAHYKCTRPGASHLAKRYCGKESIEG